jgi:hypothetical protein
MRTRDKQDGIRSWYHLVQQYETDGNRNVRIKRLESVINKVFHSNYRGGPVKWIQEYEDAFTELALLGHKAWNDDEIKYCRFVYNAQNTCLVDSVFEEVVIDKSFIETCDFLRSHAVRLDQQYKEKATRQIHNTSQLSNGAKKDKVKKVLVLINEIQFQYSCIPDEESTTVPPTKTGMACRLAKIQPEICMTLPLEANKWLLNERKCQQQKYYKMRKK